MLIFISNNKKNKGYNFLFSLFFLNPFRLSLILLLMRRMRQTNKKKTQNVSNTINTHTNREGEREKFFN